MFTETGWFVLIFVELVRSGCCHFHFTLTFHEDPRQHLLSSCFQDVLDMMTVQVSHDMVCVRSQNTPSEDRLFAQAPEMADPSPESEQGTVAETYLEPKHHWDSSCMKPGMTFLSL